MLMQKDLHQLISRSTSILDNFQTVSEKALQAAETAEKHFYDIIDSIDNVKSKVSSITTKVKSEATEHQVMTFVTNLRALVKGISVFLKGLRE